MSHPLDRPVWSALTSRHAHLAEGDARAKRYRPSIVPFAAAADDRPDSAAALAALVAPGESIMMAEANDLVVPAGLTVAAAGRVVQMVAAQPIAATPDDCIVRLGDDDAAEMLALALLTKPGPFTLGAQALGAFWGVKIDGRLAAMAGERMAQPGFAELSGVCSHPDHRGRGLGRRLSRFVAGRICGRGDTPYLHAYDSNDAAIGLYGSLGFRHRRTLNLAVARRPA